MTDRPHIEFEPGESVPAARVLETMQPHRQSEVLCAVIKRGDDELVHWALVRAAELEDHAHANVLQEAAGSDNAGLALEAVRSQAALGSGKARIGVLGRALWSGHETVALEAADRLRDFDLRDRADSDYMLQHDVCDALCFAARQTKHESVVLQILDLATQPGLHNKSNEFRVMCVAQNCSLGSVGLIARARVVEMQSADSSLNEFAYRY